MTATLQPDSVTIQTADAGPLTLDLLRSDLAGTTDPADVVIALHGFPQGARAWTRVADLLAADGIAVVAIDQRGYSPRARPVGVEHYLDNLLSADVLAVADALGLERFHLAGHDWGSHVAWVTAAHHPGRVRTLTAVSVPHPSAFGRAIRGDADQAERSQYMKLFRQPGVAEETLLVDDAAQLRAALDDVQAEDAEHYVRRLQEPGALTAALSWYRGMGMNKAETPSVTVPTTFVWSDGDRALGRAGAELCREYVDADYRLVELHGVSHWIPERAPQPLAEAIAARVRG
ncbi:alpha/beta fold hydrolase [Cumulibacter manganitolerans]|uniref:alpha/beta fold hydrolase n=1 Tax=Cumulibacter manganitolerans TaxID=1884992 RepID=UPI001296677B|nr:alpha/beta hydrolase [Cumulibacter manganitolerans]